MRDETPATSQKRLGACEGVSVAISYGAHPAEVVSPAGHLRIQTSGYQEVDLDEVLPLLRDLPETFDLEFLGPVTDEQLRHLAGLHNILTLRIRHGQVTDEGMKYLAGLNNLRVLDLSGQPITGKGVRRLGGLARLETLHLGWTQTDDEGLETLGRLSQLTDLDLSSCPVTDRGINALAGLANLRTLELRGTQILGPGLAALARLTSLRRLSLDCLPITDEHVAVLAALPVLHTLSLRQSRVGNSGAGWLCKLPQLASVDLGGTPVTEAIFPSLHECLELGSLFLDGTQVTGEGFGQLPESLSVLFLEGTRVRPEFLPNLAHLRNLKSLCLDSAVVDDALRRMLRRLGLGPAETGREGVVAFGRLRKCPLCDDVIDEGDRVFYARPFSLDADLYRFVETPMHWDCYARWEQRPRFARQYFNANVDSIRHNQFWEVVRCDEEILVTVNPSEYVREASVVLAETGSDFRIYLDDWADWLEGEWFEACSHECEREALGAIIPSLREQFPTGEVLINAAGMSADGDEDEASPTREPGGMVERISHEFACEKLAKRAAQKGITCPRCGQFSDDYDYRRVGMVTADGPQSCLVCKSCQGEFGPFDV